MSARYCSGNASPQELEVPVPKAARDDDFESLEAGPTGTLSSASPDTATTGDLEDDFLKGSVYRWAAMIDTTATDAIAGWIILMAQIACYILLLDNSPARTLADLYVDSIVHEPIEIDHPGGDDFSYISQLFSAYTSDGAAFIKTRHSAEPVSYSITSISAAVYLVLTFASGDLRAALALLHTKTLYKMILGVAILASFVLLVVSSLSILFFLASDNASFIVGAATVLFISDLDEKLFTALEKVIPRYRLFWCVEAFAVSLALAIAGITWFGNVVATSADGIDTSKPYTGSALVVFELGFVWLIAPIGATVGAWEVALLLQYIAGRYSNEEAISPRNLGNFLVVEILAMCSILGLLFLGVYALLPLALPAAALTAKLFTGHPRCVSLGRLKMFVGIGVGFVISLGHFYMVYVTMYPQWSSWSKEEEYLMFAAAAVASLVLSKYLVKAIGESFQSFPSCPVDMGALAWTLKCCKICSGENHGREADPTVFGTALVTWSLSVRALFVFCVVEEVIYGGITF